MLAPGHIGIGVELTSLRASSSFATGMLVHVRCIIVSMQICMTVS